MYIIYIYFSFLPNWVTYLLISAYGGSGCGAGLAHGTSCGKSSNSIL